MATFAFFLFKASAGKEYIWRRCFIRGNLNISGDAALSVGIEIYLETLLYPWELKHIWRRCFIRGNLNISGDAALSVGI